MKEPVKIIVVGMGQRSLIYAKEALAHPEEFCIVGVADINEERIRMAQELFHIPKENCFSTVEELVAVPKFADAVINGTMDHLHVPTTIPLLQKGYDVLLEKPMALHQKEADELLACAEKTGRKVMICHVLRYAPFYRRIKEVLTGGEIGSVINIQMNEQISFYHVSVAYIRGKYGSKSLCGSGMLLSKCSHDLDIMAWLMQGNLPKSVCSVGSMQQFLPENAPEEAGHYCLLDCPVERDCIYSAKRLYLEHPQRWSNNVWHDSGIDQPSEEEKLAILTDRNNPYSQCVYNRELQIVDHQSVMVAFENGATGTLSMNGGASAAGRNIHITGTRGEVIGSFEDEAFTVHTIAPECPGGRRSRVVDVSKEQKGNAHGNGDQAVIRDFITLLRGEGVSPCCTTLETSMVGHRIVFLAEASREQGGLLELY